MCSGMSPGKSSHLVGAYIPCGCAWTMWSHLCSQKQKWRHSHSHHHHINNATSSLFPHQQPCKPTNTMQAAQLMPVCHLDRYVSFTDLLLLLLNLFLSFFLLGSILLLMTPTGMTPPTPTEVTHHPHLSIDT